MVRFIMKNSFCPYCLIATGENNKCGNCGQDTFTISSKVRIPKKNAKKKEWKKLFNAYPHLLELLPETKALKKLGFKK